MPGGALPLATGFSHGFLVTVSIGLLALIIALAAIRVTRVDLSGVDPLAAPPTERAQRAGVTELSLPPDAPKQDHRPEPGHPR